MPLVSRSRNILDAKDDHIKTLRIVMAGLVLLLVALWWGWKDAPRHIRVDIPPDIRSGSTQVINERLPTTIYAFAFYIFQQLNRWPKNGEIDYDDRIESLRHYLTPACYENRKQDFFQKRNNGELRDRERTVSEIPGRGYDAKRIYIESNNSWVAYLDLQVMEVFRGEPVKDTFVRFPVRVVRYETDTEKNPFGLALDCFSEEPLRIELESVAASPHSTTTQGGR